MPLGMLPFGVADVAETTEQNMEKANSMMTTEFGDGGMGGGMDGGMSDRMRRSKAAMNDRMTGGSTMGETLPQFGDDPFSGRGNGSSDDRLY